MKVALIVCPLILLITAVALRAYFGERVEIVGIYLACAAALMSKDVMDK